MKNSQKGFIVPLLSAIIALLVVGGGYFYVQNKNLQEKIVTTNPSITLTSPNGGEVFKRGDIVDITWKTSGLGIESNIGFEIIPSPYYPYAPGMITATTPNTGNYKWTIKQGSAAGSYKIKVYVQPLNGVVEFMDESDTTFSITSATTSINLNWRTFKNDSAGISISFPTTFKAVDGIEDFNTLNNDGSIFFKNSEYFCDGECTKRAHHTFHHLGIYLANELVDQKLIDSWGSEIQRSKKITLNDKEVWLVESCVQNCRVSFMYNRESDRVNIDFSESLLDTKNDLLISDLAQQILKTLQF